MNSVFKAANSTTARYRVLLGSAGSGKSVNVAQDYILKLSDPRFVGSNLMVVRSAEVSHTNSTFAELTGAIYRLGLRSIWQIRMNPLGLKCLSTGAEVIFRGCNDARAIERLKSVTVQSGKLTWVWIEEATELRQSDFEIIDDRLRGVLPDNLFYQITLTFNPVNQHHWIKRTLWDYEDSNIFKSKSTYLDNHFIDGAYKERMLRRKTVDPEGYEIYGLGNWGNISGQVFHNYTVGEYRQREFDYYTMGADWGFNHATAILLIGWKDDSPYVLREVYETGKTTSEIIRCCEDAGIPKRVACYCDSAEPDRILEFRKAGYRVQPVTKEKNSILNQITWLKQRTIYIDAGCVNLHKEIQQYRYEADKFTGGHTDTPLAVYDDAIAALRYGIEPVRKSRRMGTMNKEVFNL